MQRLPNWKPPGIPGFRKLLENSRNTFFFTGTAVSAESGVPVLQGKGAKWLNYRAHDVALNGKFERDPFLVWEYYNHRRQIVAARKPNHTHYALAVLQQQAAKEGKVFNLATGNVDGFHSLAGSTNVLEIHGSLWKTRCLTCNAVAENRCMPIVPSIPEEERARGRTLTIEELPHCHCGGLLRPHIVMYDEDVDYLVLDELAKVADACDLCVVLGSATDDYPAKLFTSYVNSKGIVIAEFTPFPVELIQFEYLFLGRMEVKFPEACGIDLDAIHALKPKD